MSSLEPTPEQFEAPASRRADKPVVMVNLLQFNDGGKASYLRYVREAGPHLNSRRDSPIRGHLTFADHR
jgi:hypothetical protein